MLAGDRPRPHGSRGPSADPSDRRCVAPKTTPVQDAGYLTDVAKADTDLATYVQQEGNVALQAMLTDGAAFCAFLRRGGGIDNALVAVAVGAKGVEAQTHLPANVHTFNTLESVALIDLCPASRRWYRPRSAPSCAGWPPGQDDGRLPVPSGVRNGAAARRARRSAGRGGDAFAPGRRHPVFGPASPFPKRAR